MIALLAGWTHPDAPRVEGHYDTQADFAAAVDRAIGADVTARVRVTFVDGAYVIEPEVAQ